MFRALESRLASFLLPFAERSEKRNITSSLRALQQEMSCPPDVRQRRQRQKLVEVLRSAKAHVPYYRELFQENNFEPERINRDVGYLRELPLLTKEIIQEQGNRLLDERLGPADLHVRKTGGSTGLSACIYYSTEALDVTAAVNRFVLEWADRSLQKREVHLASNFPEAFPLKDRVREWFKCTALNRKNIFTASFDDDSLQKVWQSLQRLSPFLVQGHPSTLYALACYIERQGYAAAGMMAVFESTGEVLDPAKRATISRVFGCRVINRYGNAEFGVVAYESPDSQTNAMKFLEPIVYPENVAGDEDVPEIVLTGLANPGMPLIRYRTGDLGTIRYDELGQAWLSNVTGRIHDVVSIGGKPYPTHYIQDLLDRIGSVLEFQVDVLPTRTRPVLRIVPRQGADTTSMKRRVEEWWGDDVIVEFIEFHQLKHIGHRGKFRYLVNGEAEKGN